MGKREFFRVKIPKSIDLDLKSREATETETFRFLFTKKLNLQILLREDYIKEQGHVVVFRVSLKKIYNYICVNFSEEFEVFGIWRGRFDRIRC